MTLTAHNGGLLGQTIPIVGQDGVTRNYVAHAFVQVDSTGNLTGGSTTLTSSRTTAASAFIVLKTGATSLYGFEVCTGANAGYLMIFDAATAPGDGTVSPARVYAVAANSSFSRQLEYPLKLTNGAVLVFSTTGPFTKTASATAFLAGDYV